jgi:hypothetical protein
MPSLEPNSGQTKVPVVKVKDSKPTISIKTGYGETNAGLKWIKYPVHTLNKNKLHVCERKARASSCSFPYGMDLRLY